MKSVGSVHLLSSPKDYDTNHEWVNKRALALRYGVSIRCIDNWVYQKRIPSVKVGRVIRFHIKRCDQALGRFERREAR